MPGTINGIGTMYYGKKNLSVRAGVCERCHRQIQLQSYDTRLWFVVVFVPIFPLGRKRVVDYCASCTAHRSMSLAEWGRLSRDVLRESREKMAADPADAEAALEHFANLSAVGEAEEAERLAQELEARFDRNADVQIALGDWYGQTGRDTEADARFLAALELQPDNKAARRAVGLALIAKGRPDEAHELLEFMATPGPDHDANVLVLLGETYQRQGRHAEAMEVFARALEATPDLGRDRGVRRLVRASQRRAPQARDILPRLPLWRSRWAWALTAAGLVVAAALGVNYYIATHRTLHVVNGLGVPVTVRLDGGGPLVVAPGARALVNLGEGRHKAEVAIGAAGPETAEFTLAAGWLDRFHKRPVFILNPGGAAVICRTVVSYSTRPEDHPAEHRVFVGRPYLAFDHVHYAFRDPPESIQMDADQKVVRKACVRLMDIEPAAVLGSVGVSASPEELMRFLESHLKAAPAEEKLLRTYCDLAWARDRRLRCRDYLAGRLGDRPVRTDWHRAYQEMCKTTGRGDEMVREYRRLAESEPGDSAVLYLTGRVLPRSHEAMHYFERAIAADAQNPYPWLGRGFHFMSEGRFAEARDACQRACRLRPDHSQMAAHLFEARLALKDYDALEAEFARKLSQAPADCNSHARLLQVRTARGDRAGVQRAHQEFLKAVKDLPGLLPDVPRVMRVLLRYAEGDAAAVLAEAKRLQGKLMASILAFNSHLELGQMDAAAAEAGRLPPAQARYSSLLVSIGYALGGEETQARAWRDKARQQLTKGNQEDRMTAALLAKAPNVRLADLRDLRDSPCDKMILLVALAQCCPKARAELLALAEKLNYRPFFPSRFLTRAIAAMK